MLHPILVAGAAGGTQGSTGRLVASLLLKQGIQVRALAHKLDSRSDELRRQGAEVVEDDLLNQLQSRLPCPVLIEGVLDFLLPYHRSTIVPGPAPSRRYL